MHKIAKKIVKKIFNREFSSPQNTVSIMKRETQPIYSYRINSLLSIWHTRLHTPDKKDNNKCYCPFYFSRFGIILLIIIMGLL
jgi:hypothetical protein